ncbi:hypothetical protein yc1106_03794 [Curvularia clavata]|uniref:Uncharacterized protein n=1 Tax=Curvularia clavata TaxID=95742 RepID=A0A9Q8Z7B7_CURCL|nr:hypothetical protein yc1106_03794 [Curvularia clavata]
MDFDDALPPPIRRSPRATLQARKQHRDLHTLGLDDACEKLDHHAPPPIVAPNPSASNSSSQHKGPALHQSLSSGPGPLQTNPVDTPPARNPARRYAPPLQEPEPKDTTTSSGPAPQAEPPASRRHPRGLVSYRNNKRGASSIKRLPPHLRKKTSLETIHSVATTTSDDESEYGHDPPEAEAPSSEWFTIEDDAYSNPPPSVTSKPSSIHSSIHSSTDSSQQSITPVETPLGYASLDHHTPQSLFRKMMPRKLSDKTQDSPPSPARLVIEKSTSISRSSSSFTLSGSTSSPSEEHRSLHSILEEADRNRPGSKSSGSSKWSASDFDISTLSEAEIKRCKKKGINPALYAEMRAAKKGKWTSPIAGNTFL